MRSRIVGALVFLLILVTVTWWRSVRANKSFPRPMQQVAVPNPKPVEDRSRDTEVEAVVRQGVAAFRKMLKANPQGNVSICSSAKDCMAKVPGLKIPAGIKMNLSLSNHGEVSGEAGRAGSDTSYYYYEGASEVTRQNRKVEEWVIEAEPGQQAAAADQTPAVDAGRDDEVQAVLRQALAAYRKLLTDNPDSDVTYCYSAAECTEKIPGLKIPAGIRMNLGRNPDGKVGGEAGQAGSGRSYQYQEGSASMKSTNHEAYESHLMK